MNTTNTAGALRDVPVDYDHYIKMAGDLRAFMEGHNVVQLNGIRLDPASPEQAAPLEDDFPDAVEHYGLGDFEHQPQPAKPAPSTETIDTPAFRALFRGLITPDGEVWPEMVAYIDARLPAPAKPQSDLHSAETIDTPEFRVLAFAYSQAIIKGSVPQSSEAWGNLITHIMDWHSARIAAARQEALAIVPKMREMLAVQGESGNWNYDGYMHGMYNGMEYMLAMIENRDPAFREAPTKWLAEPKTDPAALATAREQAVGAQVAGDDEPPISMSTYGSLEECEKERARRRAAPVPAPAAVDRDAVLEEAERAIDELADAQFIGEKLEAAISCIAAIRALKGKAAPAAQAAVPEGWGRMVPVDEVKQLCRDYSSRNGSVFIKDVESSLDGLADQYAAPAAVAAHAAAPEGWPGDDGEALIHLAPNFTDTAGLLQPKAGYAPTAQDFAAINYLCNEWDYGYDAAPAAAPQAIQQDQQAGKEGA